MDKDSFRSVVSPSSPPPTRTKPDIGISVEEEGDFDMIGTICPQTGWVVVPGCQAGKQGAREKGNLCARWPCVFNWLLGKAEKVMCTNQSRITDQSEAGLTRSPPMRGRVCVSSSSHPGLDRGSGQRALFTKTKCGDGLVADGEQADILLQSQLATGTSSQTPRAPSAGPRWPGW